MTASIINWPTAIIVVVVAVVVTLLAGLVFHERKVWGSVRFGVFLERKRLPPERDGQDE